MPSINYETNLTLTWSEKYVISNGSNATTIAITNTKLFLPVVTLLTQDNGKLLEQLKCGFKRIKSNKYQPKFSPGRPNQYLNFLIDPSF